jgi:drug/metabolite transporter (DMT)-like permease
LEKKGDSKINKRWLIFCLLAFIFQGSIGVLQKIHQSSVHKDETGAFLFVAFICSLLYSHIRAKKNFKELNFTKKHLAFALICGICTFGMNFLNLRLSGLLPSQLFFPIVNGSAIILSSVMSVLLFKEKLTKKQIIGLCGGILSLIAICLVK